MVGRRVIDALFLVSMALVVFAQGVLAQDSDSGVVPDDNTARWAFLVGIFLPMGIALVNQTGWSRQLRGIVTFLCCLIAAVGTAYFAGELDGEDIVSALLIILVMATLTYRVYWGPEASGLASTVEAKTSFTKPTA